MTAAVAARSPARILPLLAAVLLQGCITVPDREPYRPPPITHYTVLPGDTLYGIAFRLDLDWRDLARWNGITDPALIHPGQQLRLSPSPASAQRPAPSPGKDAGRPPAQASAGAAGSAPDGGGDAAERNRVRAGAAATEASLPPSTGGASPPAQAGRQWRWPGHGELVAGFGDPASGGRGIDIGGREGDSVVAAAAGRVVYSGSGLIGYGNLVIIKHDDTYLSAYGHNSVLLVAQGQDVRAGQRIALMGLGPGRKPLLHFEIRRNGQPVDPLEYLPARGSGS